MIQGQATPGSPFAAKVSLASLFQFIFFMNLLRTYSNLQVYDVNAIRVKEVTNGTVGKPVTFLGIV